MSWSTAPRVLTLAIIAGVAGIIAAGAALWRMAISLRTLARKSSLKARIEDSITDWQWSDSGKYLYKVGCNVVNHWPRATSANRAEHAV